MINMKSNLLPVQYGINLDLCVSKAQNAFAPTSNGLTQFWFFLKHTRANLFHIELVKVWLHKQTLLWAILYKPYNKAKLFPNLCVCSAMDERPSTALPWSKLKRFPTKGMLVSRGPGGIFHMSYITHNWFINTNRINTTIVLAVVTACSKSHSIAQVMQR